MPSFSLCLLLMVAGMLSRFLAARRLARTGRLRAALTADVLGPWLFFGALCVGNDLTIHRAPDPANIIVYSSILTAALLLISHLWPKLDRQRVQTPMR